jgi:hypothetical protein
MLIDLFGHEVNVNDYIFYAPKIGGKGGMNLVRVGKIIQIENDIMFVKAAGWFGWKTTGKNRWQVFDRLAELNKDSLFVKYPADLIPVELRDLLNV